MSGTNAELIARAREQAVELTEMRAPGVGDMLAALADALEAAEAQRDAARSVVSLVREDYLGSGRLTNRGQQALSRAAS